MLVLKGIIPQHAKGNTVDLNFFNLLNDILKEWSGKKVIEDIKAQLF